jgi:orotate phosphoribosyltransferase
MRVLIVDDVITAGTAIRESMDLLAKADANVVGVIVALDREESTGVSASELAQEVDKHITPPPPPRLSAIQV